MIVKQGSGAIKLALSNMIRGVIKQMIDEEE